MKQRIWPDFSKEFSFEHRAHRRRRLGKGARRWGPATKGEVRDAVEQALDDLDNGHARVAEKIGGDWHVING